MNHQSANWLVLISLFFAGLSTVDAVECRATPKVIQSLNNVATPVSQVNCDTGGHIWKHLNGIRARPTTTPKGLCDLGDPPTQEGKTMFADEASFLNAFTQWRQKENPHPTPKKCGTAKVEMDCVPAAQVGITEGLVCRAANRNTGLCTASVPMDPPPAYVAFRYKKDKDTGGVWIMNTAYPSVNKNCS